jgi:hypothetical protein
LDTALHAEAPCSDTSNFSFGIWLILMSFRDSDPFTDGVYVRRNEEQEYCISVRVGDRLCGPVIRVPGC